MSKHDKREPVASPQATRPECKWCKRDLRLGSISDDYCSEDCEIKDEEYDAAHPAAGTTPTRNSEVLADFVKYCEAHPAQRFWQALRNWSEYHFVEVRNPGKQHLDTFDWEGRRHDK